MSNEAQARTATIRSLNNTFRRSFIGGVVVLTAGVEHVAADRRRSLLRMIRNFADFTPDNDPTANTILGSIDEDDISCFWKIDYFNRDMKHASPDPADPKVTTRVLTVMLTEEY